jgi:hypothetical protein
VAPRPASGGPLREASSVVFLQCTDAPPPPPPNPNPSVRAELGSDGSIIFEGYIFKSPSAFSVYVKRKQVRGGERVGGRPTRKKKTRGAAAAAADRSMVCVLWLARGRALHQPAAPAGTDGLRAVLSHWAIVCLTARALGWELGWRTPGPAAAGAAMCRARGRAADAARRRRLGSDTQALSPSLSHHPHTIPLSSPPSLPTEPVPQSRRRVDVLQVQRPAAQPVPTAAGSPGRVRRRRRPRARRRRRRRRERRPHCVRPRRRRPAPPPPFGWCGRPGHPARRHARPAHV